MKAIAETFLKLETVQMVKQIVYKKVFECIIHISAKNNVDITDFIWVAKIRHNFAVSCDFSIIAQGISFRLRIRIVQKLPNRCPAGLLWKLESKIKSINVFLHFEQFLTGVVESPQGSEVALTVPCFLCISLFCIVSHLIKV